VEPEHMPFHVRRTRGAKVARNPALRGTGDKVGSHATMNATATLKPETAERLRHVSTATLCTQLFKRV